MKKLIQVLPGCLFLAINVLSSSAQITSGPILKDLDYSGIAGRNLTGLTVVESAQDNIPDAKLPPIKLISFNALVNDGKVELAWVTPPTVTTNHYTIEKSLDGVNFEKAGIVFASNGTTEKVSYAFPDMQLPKTGTVYYRLRAIDITGKSGLSEVRVVHLGSANEQTVKITTYPNPVVNQLDINTPDKWQRKKINFVLIDNNGKTVLKREVENAHAMERISLSQLPAGFYFLTVTCNGEVAKQKIIKQ
jgi:hypothetical protein